MDRAIASLWRGSDLSTISADNKGASFQQDESDLLLEDAAAMISDTLQVYDSGTGGTLLHSSTGSGVAGSTVLRFVNVSGSGFATANGSTGYSATSAALAATTWAQNANNCTFVFHGASNETGTNGGGVESWPALLVGSQSTSGTMGSGAYSWFKNHGTFVNNSVGGCLAWNGTGNTISGRYPQTVTASWTGVTGSINLSSSCYSLTANAATPVMSVTGSNIPFGDSGTLYNSGTTLILAHPTTGSASSTTLRLGGVNILDQMPVVDYPYSPAATGGTNPAYLFITLGANDNNLGVSATNTEQALYGILHQITLKSMRSPRTRPFAQPPHGPSSPEFP